MDEHISNGSSAQFTALPGTERAKPHTEPFSVLPPLRFRRVLGIDPGLASTGFGIVDCRHNTYRMVSYGVIETPASKKHGERLVIIYNRLRAVIDEFSPEEASMETLYFSRNVSSAMGVAEARGVTTLCLAQCGIPLSEYTPNQIKLAVTGSAQANKAAVEKYVQILLNLKTAPKPDHAADALAGALTHLHYSR